MRIGFDNPVFNNEVYYIDKQVMDNFRGIVYINFARMNRVVALNVTKLERCSTSQGSPFSIRLIIYHR